MEDAEREAEKASVINALQVGHTCLDIIYIFFHYVHLTVYC